MLLLLTFISFFSKYMNSIRFFFFFFFWERESFNKNEREERNLPSLGLELGFVAWGRNFNTKIICIMHKYIHTSLLKC